MAMPRRDSRSPLLRGESNWLVIRYKIIIRCTYRLTSNLSEQFLLIDEAALASSDFFLGEQLAAYAPSLMIAIKGLAAITPVQFKRNAHWISTLLSSTLLCNDRMVRTCVQLVYETQVNPILLLSCDVSSI